jgi:hypothetical protein
VPAPPGVVMITLPEIPRNAKRAQSEGRAKGGAARPIIKGLAMRRRAVCYCELRRIPLPRRS